MRLEPSSTVIDTWPADTSRYDMEVCEVIGEPSGTRTRDPLIKSQVLYRLS